MKGLLGAALLCLVVVAGGCGGSSSSANNLTTEASLSKTGQSGAEAEERGRPYAWVPQGNPPKKLVIKDLIKGNGATAKAGDVLTVEYLGVRYKSGLFSSSWDDEPFQFKLGADDPEVAPGWERGLEGMNVGGRRKLILPPNLVFAGGAPSDADPEDWTIIYVIDLLAAE